MEKREQLKSMEEYVEELASITSLETVEEFRRLWTTGERIRAIQILRQYKIVNN